MVNFDLLSAKIYERGVTIVSLSQLSGIPICKLQRRLNGEDEFTASEIVSLSRALALKKNERDIIFLSEGVK